MDQVVLYIDYLRAAQCPEEFLENIKVLRLIPDSPQTVLVRQGYKASKKFLRETVG